MRTIRFYPSSGIESWGGWPEDVRPTLYKWNSERRLSFRRIGVIGGSRDIFQCEGCEEWYEPSTNGVATFNDRAYCDSCLIVVARVYIRANEILPT